MSKLYPRPFVRIVGEDFLLRNGWRGSGNCWWPPRPRDRGGGVKMEWHIYKHAMELELHYHLTTIETLMEEYRNA